MWVARLGRAVLGDDGLRVRDATSHVKCRWMQPQYSSRRLKGREKGGGGTLKRKFLSY